MKITVSIAEVNLDSAMPALMAAGVPVVAMTDTGETVEIELAEDFTDVELIEDVLRRARREAPIILVDVSPEDAALDQALNAATTVVQVRSALRSWVRGRMERSR